MWFLTESQTRKMQSVGLLLIGIATLMLGVVVVVQAFWRNEPLVCDDKILPSSGYCAKIEAVTNSNVRIESGEIEIHDVEDAVLTNTDRCPEEGGLRGHTQKYQEFYEPFEKPPNVVLSLMGIDHTIVKTVNNLRINTNVVEETVTAEGFYYNLNTWCDTRIVWAKASWIAYGQ